MHQISAWGRCTYCNADGGGFTISRQQDSHQQWAEEKCLSFISFVSPPYPIYTHTHERMRARSIRHNIERSVARVDSFLLQFRFWDSCTEFWRDQRFTLCRSVAHFQLHSACWRSVCNSAAEFRIEDIIPVCEWFVRAVHVLCVHYGNWYRSNWPERLNLLSYIPINQFRSSLEFKQKCSFYGVIYPQFDLVSFLMRTRVLQAEAAE